MAVCCSRAAMARPLQQGSRAVALPQRVTQAEMAAAAIGATWQKRWCCTPWASWRRSSTGEADTDLPPAGCLGSDGIHDMLQLRPIRVLLKAVLCLILHFGPWSALVLVSQQSA